MPRSVSSSLISFWSTTKAKNKQETATRPPPARPYSATLHISHPSVSTDVAHPRVSLLRLVVAGVAVLMDTHLAPVKPPRCQSANEPPSARRHEKG